MDGCDGGVRAAEAEKHVLAFMLPYSTQRHRDAERTTEKSTTAICGRGVVEGCRLSSTKSLFLCVSVFICILASAQLKPRIDFDGLLKKFPDLPWDFEIRYVVHEGGSTDMLRLYYDRRVDLVRWRPDDPGSLAEVCHGTIDGKQLRHVLQVLRDKNFNDLPTDSETLRAVADRGDATISVRVGKTTVRKIDRRERENPGLAAVEVELDSVQKSVAADPRTDCETESVPARP